MMRGASALQKLGRGTRSPGPLGIYYGWWVVAALFACGMAIFGAGLYGFTLFVHPLSEEFGWSQASLAGLVSIFWLSAPLSLLSRRLNSLLSPLQLILIGVGLEATCLALLSLVSELWQMYLLRALMGVGKVLVAITIPVIASRWFSVHFGKATAICYSGWHFGGLVVAPLAQWFILSTDWRTSCLILAGFILILGLVPMLFALRARGPEDLGLGADGVPWSNERSEQHERHVVDVKSAATVGSAAFKKFLAGTVAVAIVYAALLTHQTTIVADAGYSETVVAAAISITAGAAFFGAIISGFVADRYPFKIALPIDWLFMLVGLVILAALPAISSPLVLYVGAISIGLGIGGFDVILTTHLLRSFSLEDFPHAFGIYYFFMLGTLFIGPIGIGYLFDVQGTYLGAMLIMGLLMIVGLKFLYDARSTNEREMVGARRV